jgi:hypothetical protein
VFPRTAALGPTGDDAGKESTMSRMLPLSHAISRHSLIAALRQELSKRADDRSICSLAAEKGIFCGGFRRFSDAELRERFSWLVRKRPAATRSDIEVLGDAWQLARQEVLGVPTACDVQSQEHDLCNGWDDFSDGDLATFYRELTGEAVRVIPADSGHTAA